MVLLIVFCAILFPQKNYIALKGLVTFADSIEQLKNYNWGQKQYIVFISSASTCLHECSNSMGSELLELVDIQFY